MKTRTVGARFHGRSADDGASTVLGGRWRRDVLELAGQPFGGARQQHRVHAHRHEAGAQRQVVPGPLDIAVQDAGGLAALHDAADGLVDGLRDLGMVGLAQVAHVGGQVGGADEGAIHAVHRQDVIQRVDGARGFDLHQHAHLIVGARQVVGDAVPARGAGQRAAHAADAGGRIAHRGDGGGGFLGRLHHGHQQRLRAGVQDLLDLHGVVPGRAHHRRDRIGGHRLQLRQRGLQRVGACSPSISSQSKPAPAQISDV